MLSEKRKDLIKNSIYTAFAFAMIGVNEEECTQVEALEYICEQAREAEEIINCNKDAFAAIEEFTLKILFIQAGIEMETSNGENGSKC